MTSSDVLFFQIAAGLIPVLFIGIAVTERDQWADWLKSQPVRGRQEAAAFGLTVIAVMLLGETFAIELSLTDDLTSYKIAVVVAAVALGTTFAGCVIAWPLYSQLGRRGQQGAMAVGFALSLFILWGIGSAVLKAEKASTDARIACLEAVARTAEDRLLADGNRLNSALTHTTTKAKLALFTLVEQEITDDVQREVNIDRAFVSPTLAQGFGC